MRKIILLMLSVSLVFQLQAQKAYQIAKALPEPVESRINHYFGSSTSIDGDYAVCSSSGYNTNQGLVYVLFNNGTQWEIIARLKPSNPSNYANFGASICISGDNIFIGAYGANYYNKGAVYVYSKPTTGWTDTTETAILTASDANDSWYLGTQIDASDNTLVVSAGGDNTNGNQSGAAYVYVKPAAGWVTGTETAKLMASNNAEEDHFGSSVAISGNDIVIGAFYSDLEINYGGCAYIFSKPVGGWSNMTETAILTASNAAEYDHFGGAVSISGDYVVVGAKDVDNPSYSTGAAYVFKKPAGGWVSSTELAILTPSDPTLQGAFGCSVSISGDNIVIGSDYTNTTATKSGAAYVFTKPLTEWTSMTETAKIYASDSEEQDYFGRSVGISGDKIIIGSLGDDEDESNSGSAYFYNKPSTGWISATEDFKINPNEFFNSIDNYYGCSVSIDGNYAVVGNKGYRSGKGIAEVFEFDGMAWSKIATLKASDFDNSLNFGETVCISGNIIAIKALVNSEKVFLFEKPVTGWGDMTETATLTPSDAFYAANFGISVSIDNDNIIIGAEYDDENGTKSGSAYLFAKPNTGWIDMTETAKLTASDAAESDFFGRSVSISGDNIVVGAPYKATETGAAYVYTKPVGGWVDTTETAKLSASSGNIRDYFGTSVAIQDNEIVIGAIGDDENIDNSGTAYVFVMPSGGWISMTETAKLMSSDKQISTYLGQSVAIGDNSLIVGASGENLMSAAYIFAKPESGWIKSTETSKFTSSDIENNDNFGCSVDISGENIIVGASTNRDYGIKTGSAYFFKLVNPIKITKEPIGQAEVCDTGLTINYTMDGINIDSFQWQVSTNDGNIFSNISENSGYAGVTSKTLSFKSSNQLNGNFYRCILKNKMFTGSTDSVIFTIDFSAPVITSVYKDTTVAFDDNCVAIVPDFINDVIATDNCDFKILQSPVSGSLINDASTIVTISAIDSAKNKTEVNFNLLFEDLSKPILSCVNDTVVFIEPHASNYKVVGTLFDIKATDNCGDINIENNLNKTATLADEEFSIGATKVVWKATDGAGNSDSCSFIVTVNRLVGTNLLNDDKISVYPNPVINTLTINTNGISLDELSILDFAGRVLLTVVEVESVENIDVTSYNSGIYILKMIKDNEVYVTKICKE